jgi:DNA uptake protein ComE-like DNA-binding protein
MGDPDGKLDWHALPWTARQRGILGIVMLVVCAVLGVWAWVNPARMENPQQLDGSRAGEVKTRLDPNQASWPELAALPSIGKALAQRIVEEREQFRTGHPAELPYRSPDDLKRVKGIGDALAESISAYLVFPQSPGEKPGGVR